MLHQISPDSLAGWEGAHCPILKNPTPLSALWASGFFFLYIKHLWAPKKLLENFMDSWKVLEFFVSKRVGTLH